MTLPAGNDNEGSSNCPTVEVTVSVPSPFNMPSCCKYHVAVGCSLKTLPSGTMLPGVVDPLHVFVGRVLGARINDIELAKELVGRIVHEHVGIGIGGNDAGVQAGGKIGRGEAVAVVQVEEQLVVQVGGSDRDRAECRGEEWVRGKQVFERRCIKQQELLDAGARVDHDVRKRDVAGGLVIVSPVSTSAYEVPMMSDTPRVSVLSL